MAAYNKAMTKRKSISKRRKAIIIGLILTLIIALYATGVKIYKVTTVNQLRDIAYQFKPEPEWVKTGEYSEEPNLTWLGCIDSTCPKYEIIWDIETPLTKEKLINLIKNAGWEANIEGTCEHNPRTGSGHIACTSESYVNDTRIELLYRNNYGDSFDNSLKIRVTK